MTAWLVCFRSSHALDSLKDGVRLNLGMEPTGGFCEQTRVKRSLWIHHILTGFQTTAEWVFHVCCSIWLAWSFLRIFCWHLLLTSGVDEHKINSSLLTQPLLLHRLPATSYVWILGQVTPLYHSSFLPRKNQEKLERSFQTLFAGGTFSSCLNHTAPPLGGTGFVH